MAPGSNGSGAGDDDALSSEVAVLRDQVSSGSRRGGGPGIRQGLWPHSHSIGACGRGSCGA